MKRGQLTIETESGVFAYRISGGDNGENRLFQAQDEFNYDQITAFVRQKNRIALSGGDHMGNFQVYTLDPRGRLVQDEVWLSPQGWEAVIGKSDERIGLFENQPREVTVGNARYVISEKE